MPTKIQFACPNGHKLAASEERIGSDVTCPKCQATFPVPAVGAGSSIAGGKRSSSEEGGATREEPKNEQMIVFLCPNNHKLNGPASLQGQPGQCPHCGAKFRIPMLEEYEEEEEEPIEEFPVGTMVGDSGDEVLDMADEVEILEEPAPVPIPLEDEAVESRAPRGPHPLSLIVRSYWSPGGNVQMRLHLANGETIEPARYSELQTTPTHGVFAIQGEADTWEVIAVCWDAVQRLDFRGLPSLPPNEFK